MIAFVVHVNGRLADKVNLAGAYVVGNDDVPLRAEITFRNGIITCKKRAAGPAGLALLWEVDGAGLVLLETIRVQERERPYVLQVELARGRLMRVANKTEEWGLLEYEGAKDLTARIEQSRDLLIKALQADQPADAARLAQEALEAAVKTSEDLAQFHALAMFARRRQSAGLARKVFGTSFPLDKPTELARKRLTGAFDFATLPINWREIEPTEQAFNWKALDGWVEVLSRSTAGIPLRGSPLLCFTERHIPDWLYIWEHDFDTIRDLAFEHVRRVINRYGQHVQTWTVIRGIHAPVCFAFSFEQLMELTRMAAALCKQVSPRGTALVELVFPFGEYYARNQRTIPPLLYADMVVQSGVSFDGFGLRFQMGAPIDGLFARDLFAASTVLDLFAKLGKPLHVTGVEVPSQSGAREGDADPALGVAGYWHAPWSEAIQGEWLHRFYEIALSKPFVESVCWQGLWDSPSNTLDGSSRSPAVPGMAATPPAGPLHGGLLRNDLAPKVSYKKFLEFRQYAGSPPPNPV
jgi:hypothetical protein